MEKIPKEQLEAVPGLFSLAGKVAVVTGGSRGLGRGIALALAAAGAHVAPLSRTQADVETVAEEIRSLGRRTLPLAIDITDEEQVQAMARQMLEEFGRIDILVNSAGIVSLKPTIEFPMEEWRKIIRVNVEGTLLCCREAGKIMLQQDNTPLGVLQILPDHFCTHFLDGNLWLPTKLFFRF